MPILAVCPFCNEGKVRAPDDAVGLSATCPRCHSCFTIVPSAPPRASARAPAPAPQPPAVPVSSQAPVAETATATRMSDTALAPAPAAPPPEPPPARVPSSLPLPVPADFAEASTGLGLPLGLVAMSLAGIGLVLSQLPYGRAGILAAAGLGLIVGLVGLAFAEGQRLVPGLAAGLNAAVLLVGLLLPGWLGLEPWFGGQDAYEYRMARAVPHDPGASMPADWVDAGRASWRLEDVRVTIRSASIGPVELTGSNTQKKWTKESYLQVWVQVTNVGVARKIDFQGWGSTSPDPSAAGVTLTDPAGKVLRPRTFERNASAAWQALPVGLFPGKSADELLVFEAPAKTPDYVRLELPGGAFDAYESVRMHIPKSFLNSRP
jgi:hypothetical protein